MIHAETVSTDKQRIDGLEQEVSDIRLDLADARAALLERDREIDQIRSRLEDLDTAVWHAKRGDTREALFSMSKAHPDFLAFYELSTKLGVTP